MTPATGRPAVDAGFHLDEAALRIWLTAKREELELDAEPEALTFADFGEEGLHHDLERYVHELTEAGALVEPLGWNVGVYALDEDDEWGNLVTVRTSTERRHPGGVGFFQVADTYDDLRPSTAVADEVGCVVRTANRLLPIARAAWIGTDPTATHHPDGLCKAHGDYECQVSTADAPPVADGAAEVIRIVFTTDDVLAMADQADVPAWYDRLPSHADADRPAMPWPQTRVRFTNASVLTQPTFPRVLVGPGAPSFPSYEAAAEMVFHGERAAMAASGQPDHVVVRIADTTARIERLMFSSAGLEIRIDGHCATGCRIEFASELEHHEGVVDDRGVEVFTLPDGPGQRWWVVLSRDGRWLDYRLASSYGRPQAPGVEQLIEPDDEDEIRALIFAGEGPTTEFKRQLPESAAEARRLARTVAAFANSRGGVLLFGIDRDEVTVVGLDRAFPEIRDRLNDIVSGNLAPRPPVDVRAYAAPEGLVVGLHVQRGDTPPYGVDPGNPRYYVRRGASTLPARPDELTALVAAAATSEPWAVSPFLR